MTADYPEPGWAEQSADAIWAAVGAVVDEMAGHSRASDVVALAVSNQREPIIDRVAGQAGGWLRPPLFIALGARPELRKRTLTLSF